MPGIYHVYVDVLHIHGNWWNIHHDGISLDIPSWCISIRLDMIIYIMMVLYPWIYHVYPLSISWYMVYPWIYTAWYIIWCSIYMVYTWYIVVYPWIFLAFWNQISRPARAAGLIQCAHASSCGWSRVFCSTRHHGNCAGEKAAHKRLNRDPTAANVPRLSLVAAVTAAAAAVSRAAFHFPSLVAGNDLNLGEGWGRGCLQDRWPMCWRALTLSYAENWENKLISNCKGDRSYSSEEPERLDWLFIAIKLNSELSFSSEKKSKHMSDMTIQIYNQNWYIVETHSISDKKDWLISDCKDKYHS